MYKNLLLPGLLLGMVVLPGCSDDKESDDGSFAPAAFETALPGTWKHTGSYGVEDGEAWSEEFSDANAVYYTFEAGGAGHYEEKGWTLSYAWTLDGRTLTLDYESGGRRSVSIDRMTASEMRWYLTDADGYWYEELVRVE